jgi:putative transposase
MKRARFSEEQIIGVLREQVLRRLIWAASNGVSEATIYNWRGKFGGMDFSEAKRLRALEHENAKLKKLLAEQMLDAAALRELLSKNGRAQSTVLDRFMLQRAPRVAWLPLLWFADGRSMPVVR